MLEDQPLDLSVRVGDYAEFSSREENDQDQDRKEPIDDYGNAAAALRLRGCFVAATSTEYSQEREDRTCSEDSDDSCSDNNQKDGSTRSRSRPPGTKPYKKNLMRRYRKLEPNPPPSALKHAAQTATSLAYPAKTGKETSYGQGNVDSVAADRRSSIDRL
ncbi:hypothetical protein WN48_08920 [Eufriesea mexicana]|uniref:Uncharacterized protein n=1 Tax=Eufriesea mexicana TaxID=516756 RepID=A0A310SL82_9HYME|nr:hypothetical protein WN48_08920 [Eufriesea mexicana]